MTGSRVRAAHMDFRASMRQMLRRRRRTTRRCGPQKLATDASVGRMASTTRKRPDPEYVDAILRGLSS